MEKTEVTVVAAYSIPLEFKKRIKSTAKSQDLNESQLVRRIFKDYFERLDSEVEAVKSTAPVAA